MIRKEFPGRSLSGIGGVETGEDAAQFILVGANAVQVCTGVMKFGYELIRPLCEELLAFMEKHDFEKSRRLSRPQPQILHHARGARAYPERAKGCAESLRAGSIHQG